MRALTAALALLPFAATAARAAESSPLAGSGITDLVGLFSTLAGATIGQFVSTQVPEPTSMALLAAGAAGLVAARRRRK